MFERNLFDFKVVHSGVFGESWGTSKSLSGDGAERRQVGELHLELATHVDAEGCL